MGNLEKNLQFSTHKCHDLKKIIIHFLKILWDCFYDYQQAVRIMLRLDLVLSGDMFNNCGWNEMCMKVEY